MEKAFPGLLNIPWDTFEKALLKRFVPAVTCLEALKKFETIQQTGSVEEFNAHFLMRAEELIKLLHVKAPDETSQIRTYMRGLQNRVLDLIMKRAHQCVLDHLSLLLPLAAECDSVQSSFNLAMGRPLATTTMTERINDCEQPAQNNKQKKRKDNPPSSSASARTSAGEVARAIQPEQLFRAVDQHPTNSELTSKLLPEGTVLRLRQAASPFGLTDKSGKTWPNDAWRQLCARDNESHKRCFYCGGSHNKKYCHSPLVSASFTPPAAGQSCHTADQSLVRTTTAAAAAVNIVEVCKPLTSSLTTPAALTSVCAAVVNATPYKGMTMLFDGVEWQGGLQEGSKRMKVLLDTGSTHYAAPWLLKSCLPTGKQFQVTLADGSLKLSVPEYKLDFILQGCPVHTTACNMRKPAGIDIILGCNWMTDNNAILRLAQGCCNLTCNVDFTSYTLRKSPFVRSDPYNSKLMWTAAHHVKSNECYLFTIHAAGQTDISECTDCVPAPGTDIDELFVEHKSSVPGIAALVQKFASVFPAEIPAGLPPDRNIAHAIPLQPGSNIPSRKMYRLTRFQEQEMINQVQALLEKGWIRPSTSRGTLW